MQLRNTTVVITGVSQGLGEALAQECEKRGAKVIGYSRSGKAGTALDLRVWSDVEAAMKEHGKIDVLINNAGWTPPIKPLEDLSEEEYDRCMDTNVKGAFTMIKAALPALRAAEAGVIVNICSRAATRGHPGLAAYSASKFALRGLTQALSRELQEAGTAVRCFSVSPGGIDTPMRAELFGEEDSAKQQPAEKVAAMIADLIEGDTPTGTDAQIVRGELSLQSADARS